MWGVLVGVGGCYVAFALGSFFNTGCASSVFVSVSVSVLAFASASCTTHMRARALLSCSLYSRLRLVVAFRVTVFPPHNHHDHNQYPTALISNT